MRRTPACCLEFGWWSTLISMPRPAPITPPRPYEPPQIFRVRIAGDELAVAGCKTASGAGPNPRSCLKSLCKNAGS